MQALVAAHAFADALESDLLADGLVLIQEPHAVSLLQLAPALLAVVDLGIKDLVQF